MNKHWLILPVIFCIFFVYQEASGVELIANPVKNPFGPNDSIKINFEIDGYVGGGVEWTATKPDGSTISGELSSFKGSKKTHLITRNAFDNQFGTWTIDYLYNGIMKTITAEVEPLIVSLSTDKATYLQGDTGIATFTTNYIEIFYNNIVSTWWIVCQ